MTSANPTPLSVDKAKFYIGHTLYWMFGLAFAIGFVATVFRYPLASIPLLLAAGLLLPPICDRMSSAFSIDITLSVRIIRSVVLGVTFVMMLTCSMTGESAHRMASLKAPDAQQAADRKKADADYLVANKKAIVSQLHKLSG